MSRYAGPSPEERRPPEGRRQPDAPAAPDQPPEERRPPEQHTSPAAPKRGLRAELRAQRRARVNGRHRDEDAGWLAEAGLAAALDAGVRAGDWVAAYESLPTEPPTEVLIEALAAHGIRVMVPITLADRDLDWRESGSEAALGPGAIAWAKVAFVPANAVDRHGTRMGQGGGSYDRALPRTAATLVALVHPWEVLLDADLPRDPHDQPVDAVLTAGQPLRLLGGG